MKYIAILFFLFFLLVNNSYGEKLNYDVYFKIWEYAYKQAQKDFYDRIVDNYKDSYNFLEYCKKEKINVFRCNEVYKRYQEIVFLQKNNTSRYIVYFFDTVSYKTGLYRYFFEKEGEKTYIVGNIVVVKSFDRKEDANFFVNKMKEKYGFQLNVMDKLEKIIEKQKEIRRLLK